MKTSKLVSLSLETPLTCPFDNTHKFPLREGLTSETVKGLKEAAEQQFQQEKERIRKDLAVQFEEQKKHILEEAERTQVAKLETLGVENKALQDLLKELRENLALKARTEIDLRNSLEQVQASQETKIAQALTEYRKIEREKLAFEAEQKIESAIANQTEKMQLQLRKLEMQRDQAVKAAEEIQRRMEAGSQQLQGEALEVEVETILRERFPSDNILEVSKGTKGADVIQEVYLPQGIAGKIIWECKVTKNWSDKWIPKIKEDMLEAGGDIAVIVSSCLPEKVSGFGQHQGVWVCSPAHLSALGNALRFHVVQIDRVRKSGRIGDSTLAAMREFIIGAEFSARVEAMTRLFTDMEIQISKERSAFDRQWKLRECQVRSLQQNFGELYGSLQGAIGEDELQSPASLYLQDTNPDQAVNQ
jgi:hypothetical protein